MSLGWILGLFGGASVLGLGALAVFVPTLIPTILSALKTAALFVLQLFSGWPLKAYLCCAVLVAGAYWFSGHTGWNKGAAWQRAQDQAIARNATVIGQRFASNLRAGEVNIIAHFTLQTGNVNVTFATATKEITRYVTAQTNSRYPLPVGLVRLHDAAILGVDPASLTCAACGPDNAPAPTTASAFSANELAWGKAYWQLRSYATAVRADDLLIRGEYSKYRSALIALNTNGRRS